MKNKAPAPVQITAEQLLREAFERQDPAIKPPKQIITDEDELLEYRLSLLYVCVMCPHLSLEISLCRPISLSQSLSLSLFLNMFIPPCMSFSISNSLSLLHAMPSPRMSKRKEFENRLRISRHDMNCWLRYAKWEESQRDFERFLFFLFLFLLSPSLF